MFTPKPSKKQQQLIEALKNTNNKGLCFLQMYSSADKSEALNLLKYLDFETIKQINDKLRQRSSLPNPQGFRYCLQFSNSFFFTFCSYQRKMRQRNWALTGIIAFGLINLLCSWTLYKLFCHYFVDQPSVQQPTLSTFRSICATLGKYIGTVVLVSYAGAGLVYSGAFWLGCVDKYFRRRGQVRELEGEMQDIVRMDMGLNDIIERDNDQDHNN